MTEKPLSTQTPLTAKEIPAYLEAKTKIRTVKETIGGTEYLRIIPNVEKKTSRILATDQEPEKEITTCLYPDGVTVTRTTYFWGQYLNVDI